MRRWIVAAAALIGVVGSLGVAGTALAHAELVSSSPANQTVVATSPPEIVLTFSESVDALENSIRLVDAAGAQVVLGPIESSGETFIASVPSTLGEGTYIVGWQAISTDSHRIRGAFTFSVGSPTPTEPGVVEQIFDTAQTSESESLLLGLGRFMSYAGIGVLLGSLVLAAALIPDLIGERRIAWLLTAAALVAVVGTALMIAAQARLIGGSYFGWVDVVDTQSGRWWYARVAAIGLFTLFIPLRSLLVSVPARLAVVLAALGVCAVVAAGGHGVAGDAVPAGFAATTIHLAAMSVWLGGLVLLVAGLPRNRFWSTAVRLSPWALGSVVVLALTGSINAWRQLGSISGLTDSSYGRWLVIKLILVVIVVVIAAFSRRMARSSTADSADPLRRTVVFEVAGMALILMATAGLVNSPPPPEAATPESASAVVDDRLVQVELEPAVTGGTEMHVYLSSPSGGLDRADEITVSASLASADLGPLDIDVVPAGPNHVVATDVDLPVAGTWSFEVTARFGEFDQVVFSVQIPVAD